MRLMAFGIYLGIGAMFHALFIGPTFDWSSAWTFGWLFGWPIMLLLSFWALALTVMIIAGLCWAVYAWIDMYAKWRARRQ